jgi:hypothetical protein
MMLANAFITIIKQALEYADLVLDKQMGHFVTVIYFDHLYKYYVYRFYLIIYLKKYLFKMLIIG